MSKRKTYSREFEIEAVRMLDSGETPAAEIARRLARLAAPRSESEGANLGTGTTNP